MTNHVGTVGPRAWQTVLDYIESLLQRGTLAPGDRLPGERALVAQLGVGRSSVREALRVLDVLGLIHTRSGSGPNSGATIVAAPRGGMSALMRLHVAVNGFPVADIVRTRLILETAVVIDLAGATPTPTLDRAVAHLEAMDDPALRAAEFLEHDAAFHLALAEASGNQVITATMAGLRSSIENYALVGTTRLPDWSATASRLRAEHRGILTAITARDASAAGSLIHQHISNYYKETFGDTSPNGSPAHPGATAPTTPPPGDTAHG